MADLEKAKREIRWAKSAADDRRWDQLEPKIQAIDDALKGVPEADAAPVLAELQPLREKLANGVREEKAGRIEREIRRSLSAAADDLSRGYAESPQLPKAVARLDSAEAREVLSADTVAKLQAEIATLQAKSGGKPAPPPPPPKPAGPASSQQAQAIESDVTRNLKFAAEEIARNPSQGESYLARAAAKLDSAEARQHLSSDAMARLQAQVADGRSKMEAALRAEKAGAVERDIRRSLSAAADELNRGYKDSPQLAKAMARLNQADAREALSPETVAKLEAEIAPLQAKSTVPSPPPPPKPTAASTPAPAARPATPAPAAPVNEQARLMENDIARTLRFVEGDIANNPLGCESGILRAEAKLASDEVKQTLPAESTERLRAQTADLRAKFEAARRADKVRVLEEFIGRFIRNGEEDLGHNRRQAGEMLDRATERLDRGDVKEMLSADSVAKFRADIVRVQKLIDAATRKDGLERAQPILKQLEERVSGPIFGGSQQPWQVLGDLDSLKSRVRGSLSDVPQDDPEVKAIEKRIAAVDAIISGQTAKLGRDQAQARVAQLWELEQKAIAGWEDESGGDAKAPTYEMPKTALAVWRVGRFLDDTDIKSIGAEHPGDKDIQATLAEARKIRESAIAKLHSAFNAAVAVLEKQPRPSNRFDLEKPGHLASQASGHFDGTAHKNANVGRAKALGDRWQAEIEADRKARQAKYDAMSAEAAAAWPKILSKIKAEEEFDPSDSGAKGRTVVLTGLRNRIGWDFSGNVHFAIWVNNTPVVGNYDQNVLAAVEAACEKAGLPLDDHTDWDAVIVVGGPGKIKERFNITVRDRNNLEIGKIEEWRPVDCVTCTVIALRAGPAAVGPKS